MTTSRYLYPEHLRKAILYSCIAFWTQKYTSPAVALLLAKFVARQIFLHTRQARDNFSAPPRFLRAAPPRFLDAPPRPGGGTASPKSRRRSHRASDPRHHEEGLFVKQKYPSPVLLSVLFAPASSPTPVAGQRPRLVPTSFWIGNLW